MAYTTTIEDPDLGTIEIRGIAQSLLAQAARNLGVRTDNTDMKKSVEMNAEVGRLCLVRWQRDGQDMLARKAEDVRAAIADEPGLLDGIMHVAREVAEKRKTAFGITAGN